MTVVEDVVEPLSRSARALAARARLEQFGASTLLDAELLEVLGVGPEVATLFELARLEHGALAARLGRRAAASVQAAIELGRRSLRAKETRPRLRTPQQAYEYLEPVLAGRSRERFHVLSLNARQALLSDVMIVEGSPDTCPIDPRAVYASALAAGARSIILAHNHPSGDPEPSANDLELTLQLSEAGRLLCISVVDHLVIGAGCYVSMAERGLGGLGSIRSPLAANP